MTMTTMGPVCERIAAEYREMPGLSLTVAQAARFFGLASDQCVTVLQALVVRGQLRRREDGRYCAAGDLERVSRSTSSGTRRAA
jgi:hypothetical protein